MKRIEKKTNKQKKTIHIYQSKRRLMILSFLKNIFALIPRSKMSFDL